MSDRTRDIVRKLLEEGLPELPTVLAPGTEPPASSAAPPDLASAPESERFGSFVRTRKLGTGAMGEVWEAWDTRLCRRVALKFLKAGSDEEIARFEREAQTAAGLSHPNIAAIYGVGFDQGRHYIVMQLVEGRTLRKARPANPREAARCIRDAALAVHAAHERGIVHRDIKPDNMMIAGGHVYVMDFGLARPAEGASGISVSGAILGTPNYMPPEQARGDRVDARADVYALGATLYDLLAGRPPFMSPNVLETLRKVGEEEPPTISRIAPATPADLELIVLKCLEKDRDRRYATARDLADDLGRFLDGEPIVARRASVFYRLRRRLLKRKAVVAVAAAGAIALIAALALLLPRLFRAERALELWARVSAVLQGAERYSRAGEVERARARLDEGIAICRESIARDETAHAQYFLGRLLRERGDRDGALAALDRAVALDPSFVEPRFERGLLLAEDYAARALRRLRAAHVISGGVPATLERDLRPLADRASADLSVDVRGSLYFSDTDALYGRAEILRVRGEFEAARRAIEEVLQRDPVYVKAHLALARLAGDTGRHDEAIAHATRAIDLHRGMAAPHTVRARSLVVTADEAKPDEARARYLRAADDAGRAVALGEPTGAACALRGYARYRTGDAEGALLDLDASIRQDPELSDAYVLRGCVHADVRNWDKAIADFATAIAKAERPVAAYVSRAGAHFLKGDVAAALRDYGAAIDLNPRDVSLRRLRADARLFAEDLDGAIEDIDRALEIDERDAVSWRQRGVLRTRQERYRDAIGDLTRAIELRPGYADAFDSRGQARQYGGDVEGALADYDEAIRLDGRNAGYHVNRAFARVVKGDAKAAAADFRRALEVAPAGWPLRAHVEEALAGVEKK